MGRGNGSADKHYPVKFDIERLEWVDGDYDQGGAYWGRSNNDYIYRAMGDSDDGVEEIFVRAKTVIEAKAAVLEEYPNATISSSSEVDIIAAAYLEAALWNTHNELFDEDPDNETENLLDSRYEPSEDIRRHFAAECERFHEEAKELLAEAETEHGYSLDQAGYDFWMTQSGSGVSFKDRGLGELGTKLYEIAKKFSEDYVYVGDDELIHSGYEYHSAPEIQTPSA
jgi:hypothetical protein